MYAYIIYVRSNNIYTNKTYILVHETDNQVIAGHTTLLRNKFNLVVYEEK